MVSELPHEAARKFTVAHAAFDLTHSFYAMPFLLMLEGPEREENCFGHLEQECPYSAILQDWFPPPVHKSSLNLLH